MEDYKKMIRKKVEDEPRELIKNAQGAATQRFKQLMGRGAPIEGESIPTRRDLIAPDVEAAPDFKAKQEELFRQYNSDQQEEMSPMEKAALLEELARKQPSRGPRGL